MYSSMLERREKKGREGGRGEREREREEETGEHGVCVYEDSLAI